MIRTPMTLAALAFATSAHAGVVVDLHHATPSIAVSVENISGSADVEDRVFAVTSAAPLVHGDGVFACPEGTAATSAQLLFGTVVQGQGLVMPFAVWDESPPQLYAGGRFGAFDLDHDVDLELEWDPQVDILTFAFNAAKVVEDHFGKAEAANADMVAWMQFDQVFVDSFPMNAVVTCHGPGGDVLGVDGVEVEVSIFFHGDPNIDYQPVAGGPGSYDDGGKGTPGYDAATGTSGTGTGGTSATSWTTTTVSSATTATSSTTAILR